MSKEKEDGEISRDLYPIINGNNEIREFLLNTNEIFVNELNEFNFVSLKEVLFNFIIKIKLIF